MLKVVYFPAPPNGSLCQLTPYRARAYRTRPALPIAVRLLEWAMLGAYLTGFAVAGAATWIGATR
jgi:hypothetical protein